MRRGFAVSVRFHVVMFVAAPPEAAQERSQPRRRSDLLRHAAARCFSAVKLSSDPSRSCLRPSEESSVVRNIQSNSRLKIQTQDRCGGERSQPLTRTLSVSEGRRILWASPRLVSHISRRSQQEACLRTRAKRTAAMTTSSAASRECIVLRLAILCSSC